MQNHSVHVLYILHWKHKQYNAVKTNCVISSHINCKYVLELHALSSCLLKLALFHLLEEHTLAQQHFKQLGLYTQCFFPQFKKKKQQPQNPPTKAERIKTQWFYIVKIYNHLELKSFMQVLSQFSAHITIYLSSVKDRQGCTHMWRW